MFESLNGFLLGCRATTRYPKPDFPLDFVEHRNDWVYRMLTSAIERYWKLLCIACCSAMMRLERCILPFRLCRRTSDPVVCRLATDVSRIDSQILFPFASSTMQSRRVQNGWIVLGERSGRLPNTERVKSVSSEQSQIFGHLYIYWNV